jgi:hypothetical protein
MGYKRSNAGKVSLIMNNISAALLTSARLPRNESTGAKKTPNQLYVTNKKPGQKRFWHLAAETRTPIQISVLDVDFHALTLGNSTARKRIPRNILPLSMGKVITDVVDIHALWPRNSIARSRIPRNILPLSMGKVITADSPAL